MNKKSNWFSPEVKERAVRLVQEQRGQPNAYLRAVSGCGRSDAAQQVQTQDATRHRLPKRLHLAPTAFPR